MSDVASSCEHLIDVCFEQVDIAGWLFSLPADEYRRCCPPDHIACGATMTDDGQPVCLTVETVGGFVLVQRYLAHVHRPDRCELVALTDVFPPAGGRTTAQVAWTLSVDAVDDDRSLYTSSVTADAPFMALLEDHLHRETPRVAESIARYSRRPALIH